MIMPVQPVSVDDADGDPVLATFRNVTRMAEAVNELIRRQNAILKAMGSRPPRFNPNAAAPSRSPADVLKDRRGKGGSG